jgi:hypothetical protein
MYLLEHNGVVPATSLHKVIAHHFHVPEALISLTSLIDESWGTRDAAVPSLYIRYQHGIPTDYSPQAISASLRQALVVYHTTTIEDLSPRRIIPIPQTGTRMHLGLM